MNKRRSRSALTPSVVIETLEGRVVLSGIASPSSLGQSAAQIAPRSAHMAATETTLAVAAGTLGQPITFTVMVRAAAKAGSPQGTVSIIDHGTVIGTLRLSPSVTTSHEAFSSATATLTQQPGAPAYYFGKHTVKAVYVPNGDFNFKASSHVKTFTVHQPTYTTLPGGVKIATVTPGMGLGIQGGQTANVLYTGYLAKNGHVFDASVNHGGTPFSYTVGAGQVIPGFDEGTFGMQVGETRIVKIPASMGYGATANGSIPANSTLVFVLTLESIS